MKAFFNPQIKENLSGVYIHFPYCIKKCDYCDFYSISTKKVKVEQEKLFQSYKKELNERIKDDSKLTNLKFNTIFIGGGTPSLAEPKLLEDFLLYLKSRLHFEKNIEISLEANPEDLTAHNINTWKQIGFNRINIGVQTFKAESLTSLNRFFDSKKYSEISRTLSNSSIERYGADLMYGLPKQTKEDFLKDLEKILNSNINHISLYALTLENNTIYYQKVKKKQIEKPNEILQSEILTEIPKYLEKYELSQYEVSNFAKKKS